MEQIIAILGDTVVERFMDFYNGPIFFGIKFFLAIYSAILIVDVILLMYLGDLRTQLRKTRKGAGNIKTAKRADLREWKAIMDRLLSEDQDQYKAAILEGDNFVYRSLEVQGYSGGTFAERLSQIPPGSFLAVDTVRDVHTLSNKIVNNKDIEITKEQAENALGVYEKFLRNMDCL